jgi:quercetin dioxygenase-like cupin family protein
MQMPTIIDIKAETAKLTMFRGLTPRTRRAERKGSAAKLPPYRDGLLLLAKSAGTGHWETHPEDEMVHVLDGAKTLEIVCDDGPPKSFEVRAGMIAIVPPGEWHRFHSAEGGTTMSTVLPGPHIELDVDDPRTGASDLKMPETMRPPAIIDLNAELAKLTMFRRTPQATTADRKGSVARLASYRDGLLLAIKASGKDHWERHLTGDELIHVLDGSTTLEIVCDDGPAQSFALHAGTVAIIPQRAWHRFISPQGFTQLAVTPFPGETVELDVDDPRTRSR